jgi:hypothetical protein
MAAEGPGFDAAVQKRGQPSQPGDIAPRRYLEVLDRGASHPGDVPARLLLAARIASADNPLTARVLVNRVWSWLFGRGIVATVDNFGATGEQPSHPELLDHLAARFVAEGWSLKQLIREIVGTQAYQSVSVPPAGAIEADPDSAEAHGNLGRALLLSGDRVAALQHLTRSRTLSGRTFSFDRELQEASRVPPTPAPDVSP